MIVKTIRGIVIKEIILNESDKFITILSKEYGKISLFCKGSRKIKSLLLAGSQIYTYADFFVTSTRKHNYVKEIEIIKSFYKICFDFEKFCYTQYFIKIIDITIPDEIKCDDILKLLIKTILVILNNSKNNKLIFGIFNIKFLQLSGYCPYIENCCICGENTSKIWFLNGYGKVCSNCQDSLSILFEINKTLLYTINYIIKNQINKIFDFEIDKKNTDNLYEITKHLLLYNFEIDNKVFDIIKI